jgi:predicted permease
MTRRHRALFALLLLAFPQAFRDRLGASMREAFAAACADHAAAGRLRRYRFLWRTAIDMVRAGLRERARPSASVVVPVVATAGSGAAATAGAPILRELRGTVRLLARTPGFTATAVVALGLSIGAATTVFSVADGVLFRPLPYAAPERLVSVAATIRARDMLNWRFGAIDLAAWRAASVDLLTLAAFGSDRAVTIVLPDAPHDISVAPVTVDFLGVLGVAPALGRDFGEADADASATPAMLITDALWRRRFQADPAIVGRTIVANGVPTVVAGVLPRDFEFPAIRSRHRPDALVALRAGASGDTRQDTRLDGVGRLADGATAEQAAAVLDRVAARMRSPSGLRDTPIDGAVVTPLAEILVTRTRSIMLLLVGAVASLLLIGCANVANLLLARGTDRQGEFALRAALGASRAALLRLQLLESAVLGVAGGLVGTAVAWLALGVIAPLVPEDLTLLKAIALDGRALAVSAGLSMATVLLFGVGPAWRSSRVSLTSTIGTSAARVTAGRLRARQAIVASEVALATVLVIAGALMANGMIRLLQLDHGFATAGVLTVRAEQPRGLEAPTRSTTFVDRVISSVRALPGVTAVGAIDHPPFEETMYGASFSVEGMPDDWMREGASIEGAGVCCTQNHAVSAGYFDAVGVPVLRGRAFTAEDAGAAEKVAIVSERLARKFPPDLDPVGHWLIEGGRTPGRRRIVGVVADLRDMSLEMGSPQTIYTPLEERGATGLTLMIRTAGRPMDIAGAVEQAIQTQAGPLVIADVGPLNDVLMRSVSGRRLNAWLFGSLGTIGLMLASVGIFGVVAYSVSHRTREIGIRMALGAAPRGVRRMVVAQAVAPVLVGLVVGLGVALRAGDLLAAHLYQVGGRDLATYAIACATLSLVALAAAWLPARRAAAVDPLLALRAE